jgi:ADP-ribose pyrophosphatase YjhB (NUDIX family)
VDLSTEIDANAVMDSIAALPIRLQSRAVIINDHGEVLHLRHDDKEPADPNEPERLSYWVVPGGKIEEGESPEQCAKREAQEETGVTSLIFERQLFVYEKPLLYREGMRMMQAHYMLFRCIGRPEVWLNDDFENIGAVRWWSLEEIAVSDDYFLPEKLFAELPKLIRTASLPSAGLSTQV